MANVTEKRKRDFVEKLRELGGKSGNKSLKSDLDWDDDTYWGVQQRLIAEGLVLPGRGKGGSVALSPASELKSPEKSRKTVIKERDLYKPISSQLKDRWVKTRGYDDYVLEETHSQGSKNTGGVFSRPDMTIVGTRSYVYLPGKHIEVVTFEIKPSDVISVIGVLEALAHREASHRSYVIYHSSAEEFDAAEEAERIAALAQKNGVGLILAEDPDDFENWDIRLESHRAEPDPDRLDAFIGGFREQSNKNKILKWLK